MWTSRLKRCKRGQYWYLKRRWRDERWREDLLELNDMCRWRDWWKIIRIQEDFDGDLCLPCYHPISQAEDEVAGLKKTGLLDRIDVFEDFVEELDSNRESTSVIAKNEYEVINHLVERTRTER